MYSVYSHYFDASCVYEFASIPLQFLQLVTISKSWAIVFMMRKVKGKLLSGL